VTEAGMFDGFALERVDVGEAVLRVRHGGAGPPVWADDLRGGRALDCGHHLSEEAPEELAAELRAFLSR
jgi:pimeloyl-ACP methyl ester carboxylesterase